MGVLITPYDGEPFVCKFIINPMVLDSPAKAAVQCFRQYNFGFGGCPVCKHPGEKVIILKNNIKKLNYNLKNKYK